jgi:serine/threonine protein kinase
LAPESYSRVITFKLDIYSLGVIIMEILTGKKGYSEIENVRIFQTNPRQGYNV